MRRLLNPASDLAFKDDESQRFFPSMLALLVGVCIVFLAMGALVGNHLQIRKSEAAQSISVHIPYEAATDVAVKKVATVLAPYNATRMSRDELKASLKPWMSSLKDEESWPLPVVFRLAGAGQNKEQLQQTLTEIHPSIRVDAVAAWASSYAAAVAVVQFSVVALCATLLLCLALMTQAMARTSMKLNQSSVDVLHGLGASDDYIIRQFDRRALALACDGSWRGMAGAVLAMAMIAGTLMYRDVLSASKLIQSLPMMIFIVLGVPLIACVIARVGVRYHVRQALRQLP